MVDSRDLFLLTMYGIMMGLGQGEIPWCSDGQPLRGKLEAVERRNAVNDWSCIYSCIYL
jgi:hypothetical protein